jgi:hypothetical protein
MMHCIEEIPTTRDEFGNWDTRECRAKTVQGEDFCRYHLTRPYWESLLERVDQIVADEEWQECMMMAPRDLPPTDAELDEMAAYYDHFEMKG